jgi:hypothetical protein
MKKGERVFKETKTHMSDPVGVDESCQLITYVQLSGLFSTKYSNISCSALPPCPAQSLTLPVRRHPLMYLSSLQMVWKSGRFTGFPPQHCWIRPDKHFGQFSGSCGLFPFHTLPLNALTEGFINSVGGKGVGSPISTQKQISPKL